MLTKNQCTIALLLFLWVAACTKIDDNYKDLIQPGGRVYVEKADAVVHPGYKKVEIVWPRSADPNVASAKIFWNNAADSVSATIDPAADTIKVNVTGLEEQYYSFTIRTYDRQGNSSVPVTVTGRAYGDNYINSLSNRFVQSATSKSGILTINWGTAAVYNGEAGVELVYTTKSGSERTQVLPNSEILSTLADYLPGTPLAYRSLFLADSNAVDTIYMPFAAIDEIGLDKTGWSLIAFSTQHPGAENQAANIIDGTYATRWHTLVPGSVYPHFVTVDMNATVSFNKFSVQRTTYAVPAGDDRGPDTFQLLVSMDNTEWTDLGSFHFNRFSNDEQFYPIASKPKARYFKFVATSGPLDYMALGEISVYGF